MSGQVVEEAEEEPTYRIERKFGPGFGREPIVVSEGVSLEYAQAHCSSPDSSGTDGEWQWMDVFYREDS